jgi:hypothetical protein
VCFFSIIAIIHLWRCADRFKSQITTVPLKWTNRSLK